MILLCALFLCAASVKAQETRSAILTWTASTTLGVSYNVYRAQTSGTYTTSLNAAPVAALTFTDGTILSGQTYFYIVRAVLNGIESVNSTEVSTVVKPSSPGGVKITVTVTVAVTP